MLKARFDAGWRSSVCEKPNSAHAFFYIDAVSEFLASKKRTLIRHWWLADLYRYAETGKEFQNSIKSVVQSTK